MSALHVTVAPGTDCDAVAIQVLADNEQVEHVIVETEDGAGYASLSRPCSCRRWTCQECGPDDTRDR